jgi:hypothetical protein
VGAVATDHGERLGPGDFLPLGLGLLALVVGTALGWDAGLVEAVVAPPPAIRAVLVALAVVGGVALLAVGLRRIGARSVEGAMSAGQLGGMIRGIRLVFLGVAAFAAAIGWIASHPLPLVIALIIAGIDVIETSFLLLVVRLRRPG